MSGSFGKLKRHDLKLLIESQYGLQVKNMQEGGRGILVHTDRGLKRLKETGSDEAKILFAASAYEHIYNNGFTDISCINRNQNGSYLMKYDKSSYILQDFTPGEVYDIDAEEAAAAAGKALGELHKAAVNFIPAPGSRARVDWGKWIEKTKANATNLKKYVEAAQLKEKRNKLDEMLLLNAAEFIDKLNCSSALLKENRYLEKVRHSMTCNQLTHNEFKKHAILKGEAGRVFVTNLEECSYDICESDVATLLSSFSGKNKAALAASALEGYTTIKPLDKYSLNIIKAFLLYPRRFCKVVEGTYGKRKNYNEYELTQKLERSIKREKRKNEIVRLLDSV